MNTQPPGYWTQTQLPRTPFSLSCTIYPATMGPVPESLLPAGSETGSKTHPPGHWTQTPLPRTPFSLTWEIYPAAMPPVSESFFPAQGQSGRNTHPPGHWTQTPLPRTTFSLTREIYPAKMPSKVSLLQHRASTGLSGTMVGRSIRETEVLCGGVVIVK
jgi:hypothetical protein